MRQRMGMLRRTLAIVLAVVTVATSAPAAVLDARAEEIEVQQLEDEVQLGTEEGETSEQDSESYEDLESVPDNAEIHETESDEIVEVNENDNVVLSEDSLDEISEEETPVDELGAGTISSVTLDTEMGIDHIELYAGLETLKDVLDYDIEVTMADGTKYIDSIYRFSYVYASMPCELTTQGYAADKSTTIANNAALTAGNTYYVKVYSDDWADSALWIEVKAVAPTGIPTLTADGTKTSYEGNTYHIYRNTSDGTNYKYYYDNMWVQCDLTAGQQYLIERTDTAITLNYTRVYDSSFNEVDIAKDITNSIQITPTSDGTYYIRINAQSYNRKGTGTISLKTVNTITNIDVLKEPVYNRAYTNIDKPYIITDLDGTKLRVTYSDGTTEDIECKRYSSESSLIYSISDYYNDDNSDIWSNTNSDDTLKKAGTIVSKVGVLGYSGTLSFNREVLDPTSATEIELGSSNLIGDGYEWREDDQSTAYSVGYPTVYKVNLTDGTTYEFKVTNNSNYGDVRLYNSEYVLAAGVENGPINSTIVYTAQATGTYYVYARGGSVNGDKSYLQFNTSIEVTKAEIVSQPSQKVYNYRFDYGVSTYGMKVKITYKDGSTKTVEASSLSCEVMNATTNKTAYSESSPSGTKHWYPVGKYYFKINVPGYDNPLKSTTISVVEPVISPIAPGAKLSIGKSDTKYLSVTLKAGQNYHFHTDNTAPYIYLYDADFDIVSSGYGFMFVPDVDATYYLQVVGRGYGGVFSVDKEAAVRSFRLITAPIDVRNGVKYIYPDYTVNTWFSSTSPNPSGMYGVLTLTDGTEVDIEAYDDLWYDYGFRWSLTNTGTTQNVSSYHLQPGTYDLYLQADFILEGESTSFSYKLGTVEAKSGKYVKNMEITKAPNKTSFKYSEDIDLTGMELTITYADDTTKTISGIVSMNGLWEAGINNDLYSSKGAYVASDAAGYIPAGNHKLYMWIIAPYTENEKAYCKIELPITVTALGNYTLSYDSNEAAVKASLGADAKVSGITKNQACKANTTYSLTAGAYTVPGLELVGWSTQATASVYAADKTEEAIKSELAAGDNTFYAVGDYVTNLSIEGGSNVKLYAVWRKATYSITYHLGGGSWIDAYEAPASFTVNSDTITLPGLDKIRPMEGFEATGWYGNNAYTGDLVTSVPAGSSSNVDVYIKWTPATYTLKFDGNGSTGGAVADQILYYGVDATLNPSKFAKKVDGVASGFLGWSLTNPETWDTGKEASEYVDIADKAQVVLDWSNTEDKLSQILKTDEDKTVTLYAVWQSEFHITYVLSDNTLVTNSVPDKAETAKNVYPDTYTYGKKVNLPTPTMKGYIFSGWYSDEARTQIVKNITNKTAGDMKLYAGWTPITYTVKFNANGGSGKMAAIKVKYDEPIDLNNNIFTRSGFTYGGWALAGYEKSAKAIKPADLAAYEGKFDYTKAEYLPANEAVPSLSKVVNLSEKNKATFTLNAIWLIDTITVTLNTQGGTLGGDFVGGTVFDVAYTDSVNLPTEVTRAGYKFDGWYKDLSYKTKITKTKGLAQNTTLYAKWTAKYTVVFDANAPVGVASADIKGTMKPQTLTTGKSGKLNKNGYGIPGYAFVGWALSPVPVREAAGAYASDVVYGNNVAIIDPTGLTADASGNLTLKLYAVWSDSFTVDYVLGAEDVVINTSSANTYRYGIGISELPVPARDGYTFAGWYADEKLKIAVKTISKTDSGNKTLYAKWAGMAYTVAFDANAPVGAKVTGNTKAVKLNVGTPKVLTKNGFKIKGYTFQGWALSANGVNVITPDMTDAQKQDVMDTIVYTNAQKITSLAGDDYARGGTLYAVWSEDVYIVDLKMGGIVADTQDTYSVSQGYALKTGAAAPARIGYTFAGWYSDAKCKKAAKSVNIGEIGNKTYYAKWIANK